MASRVRIPPGAVHDTLRRHLLAGGYPIVLDLEKSQGAFAYDSLTGDRYLDFGSFYGSNPLGYAHPGMLEPDVQAELTETRPAVFQPCSGGWGRMGWTTMMLAKVSASEAKKILADAYALALPKSKRTR